MNNSVRAMLEETMEKMDPGLLAETLANTATRSSADVQLSASNADRRQNKRIKRIHNQDDAKLLSSQSSWAGEESPVNEYAGWTVPCQNYIITAIKIDGLTPEQFFTNYIRVRRPVVLQGTLPELDHFHKWTNDYLREKAGHHTVMVEKRASTEDSFGRGNEVPMSFSQFLDLLDEGDSNHYLTTQDVEANEDGRPDLMAPFMKSLQDDFPLIPNIVKSLVPQNINLWMGQSKEGASSGLHHDYHDNLYFVLRGRKLIQLYSPKDAENMYTRGKLVKVHPNGRINYEGEITTAYGADLKADAASKAEEAKEVAEKRLEEAEAAVQEGKEGAQEELEKAEEMLEVAMDALIDAERDSENGGDDEAEDEGSLFAKLDDNNKDEEEAKIFDTKPLATSPRRETGTTESSTPEETDSTDYDAQEVSDTIDGSANGDLDTASESGASKRLVDKTVKNPNNFSKAFRYRDNDKDFLAKFPDIKKANAAFCELGEGDILYLPASWFHEVVSLGSEEKNENGDSHLAFNYWFHPPDSLSNFEKPYSTDFWPNDYNKRFDC